MKKMRCKTCAMADLLVEAVTVVVAGVTGRVKRGSDFIAKFSKVEIKCRFILLLYILKSKRMLRVQT